MNRVINNAQVSEIRVLSWNINGLGNKMTDPDLFTFIRNYDIIFFIETMKGIISLCQYLVINSTM